jgi:hypothetical protein
VQVLEEMKSIAGTLKQLVSFLTEERKSSDDAIKTILLTNHPAFRAFAELTGTKYRVFFTNKEELDMWLETRSYKLLNEEEWDEGSISEWANKKLKKYIRLTYDIFDDNGRLIPLTEDEWGKDWIEKKDLLLTEEDDDYLPF